MTTIKDLEDLEKEIEIKEDSLDKDKENFIEIKLSLLNGEDLKELRGKMKESIELSKSFNIDDIQNEKYMNALAKIFTRIFKENKIKPEKRYFEIEFLRNGYSEPRHIYFNNKNIYTSGWRNKSPIYSHNFMTFLNEPDLKKKLLNIAKTDEQKNKIKIIIEYFNALSHLYNNNNNNASLKIINKDYKLVFEGDGRINFCDKNSTCISRIHYLVNDDYQTELETEIIKHIFNFKDEITKSITEYINETKEKNRELSEKQEKFNGLITPYIVLGELKNEQ